MRRVLRTVFWGSVLLVVGAVALVVVLLDDGPRVAAVGAPAPEDVGLTQGFVHQVRRAVSSGVTSEADRIVTITQAQANGIARVASRFARGARGEVRIEGRRVLVAASVPVPWPGGQKWLNASAVAPEFVEAPTLNHLEVGGLSLPPAPLIELARIGANVVLGNDAGDIFLRSASRLEIDDGNMRITLRLDESGKSDFAQGVFGALRGSDMPGTDRIAFYYFDLREAMDAGRLPSDGSYLPYLRYVLEKVADKSTDQTLANEYTAAIFALANTCGAAKFELVVGPYGGAPDDGTGWTADCGKVLFSGRVDTRRHFTTAAAIQAASNRGFSVTVGEMKELMDSVTAGHSGFDFSDITANNSGIRLSNLVMRGSRDDLRRTLELMREEGDVLVDLDLVPPIMDRTEFEARFGSIESAEYAAMLARIEGLIDTVTIHRAPE